jgi:hypothetical protein
MSTRYRDLGAAASPAAGQRSGRRFVVTIGIDQYAAWPRLHNAVNDAKAVHDRFVALGFEAVAPPILNQAATGAALRGLAGDDLAKLGRRDTLVIFFAGHGHTDEQAFEDGTVDRVGYVIPADARLPGDGSSSWLRVDAWLRDVARLPARHILVILDSCHSGIALAIDRDSGSSEDALAILASRRSRRVMTSAHATERAADGGPFPGLSLFTGALSEMLAGNGVGDGVGDQVITSAALALAVQRRVIALSGSRQTPDFGRFVLDDSGDLLIALGTVRDTTPSLSAAHSLASPLRRYLHRAPVIGDFLDTRAGARRGASSTSRVTVAALAAITGLVFARPWLVPVVGHGPAFWLWLILPAALCVLALRIVCSTRRSTLRYLHAQALRVPSKLVAIGALVVLVQRLATAAAMPDAEMVRAYICADGHPVQDAEARLLDQSGVEASTPNGPDRAGYVVLTVKPRILGPLTVTIARPGCSTVTMPIAATRADGCALSTRIAKQDNEQRLLPIWRLDRCDTR